MENDDRPIGLFDSGIGGLTVLRTLLSQLSQESFIYLGDTARLPYGNKSAATIERYLVQNIKFLKAQGVKAIVVACNSASTVLLDRTHDFGVPIYNVIEPGAAAAVKASTDKRIGVLGTRATVAAQSYLNLLKKLDPAVTVFSQACPLLVPLVEEGWGNIRLTRDIIRHYLHPVLDHGIDTLILGCTHYPLLKSAITQVVGKKIRLVDSAENCAIAVRRFLDASDMRAPKRGSGKLQLFVTDRPQSFSRSAKLFLGGQAPMARQI